MLVRCAQQKINWIATRRLRSARNDNDSSSFVIANVVKQSSK